MGQRGPIGQNGIMRRRAAAATTGQTEPAMPKGLCSAARREWKRVTDLLRERGVLDGLDEAALADLIRCWQRLQECEADITARGVLVQGERGLVKNPAAQLATSYRTALLKWCSEFGLTVNSRSRLDLPPPKRELSPTAKLLLLSSRRSETREVSG